MLVRKLMRRRDELKEDVDGMNEKEGKEGVKKSEEKKAAVRASLLLLRLMAHYSAPGFKVH
jgi:hypothetical protein